jgi:hypothetical protein
MLDSYIIDQLQRIERERARRERPRAPRPAPQEPPGEPREKVEEAPPGERGVVVIDLGLS